MCCEGRSRGHRGGNTGPSSFWRIKSDLEKWRADQQQDAPCSHQRLMDLVQPPRSRTPPLCLQELGDTCIIIGEVLRNFLA
jgi:hypothetical protein